MSSKMIRRCDICHKTEGRELTHDDFVNGPIKMRMNSVDGGTLTLSCSINIQPDNNSEYIIEDVVDNYSPADDFSYMDDCNPTNLNVIVVERQLAKVDSDITIASAVNKSDICKVCFNNALKMIDRYAEHGKVVKF